MLYPPADESAAVRPHVLVADDDDATRCFLGNAFHQFGTRVALASDGDQAQRLAREEAFDLLVLDCRMPGSGAMEILTRLRSDQDARSRCSPAIASSAELDAGTRQALLAGGFHGVLQKPCTLQELREILAVVPSHHNVPVLDDRLALHTSGTTAVVHALRGLFHQELVALCAELDVLSKDADALEARLHRLRSSCGFCGAAALREQISVLQQHLKLGHREGMLPLATLRQSMQQTIDALSD